MAVFPYCRTFIRPRHCRFSLWLQPSFVCFLFFGILSVLTFSAASAEEHVIKKGETALQIAIDHDLTMDQLSRLNPGIDLEMMRVGDILIVPDEGAASFDEYLDKLYGDFIQITDLNCVPAADRSAVCLFHAENLSDLPLFDVRFKAAVRGGNGNYGETESAIVMMQIQPGEKLPVCIGVPGNFDAVEQASVIVLNLSYSEMLQSSFRIPADQYSCTHQPSPDGIGVVSTVVFNSDGMSAYQDKSVNILSAAYGRDGRLIGVRSLYSDFYPRLDITVYSADGPIDTVEIRMEAY